MAGDEPAVHVQRVVRGFLGRLAGQAMVTEMLERRHAGWLLPAATSETLILRYVCSAATWISKRVPALFRLTSCTLVSAALRQANLVYEKIFDPRTHAYYYYNTHTFETTWQVTNVVFMRATHALLRCPAGIARCITS